MMVVVKHAVDSVIGSTCYTDQTKFLNLRTLLMMEINHFTQVAVGHPWVVNYQPS